MRDYQNEPIPARVGHTRTQTSTSPNSAGINAGSPFGSVTQPYLVDTTESYCQPGAELRQGTCVNTADETQRSTPFQRQVETFYQYCSWRQTGWYSWTEEYSYMTPQDARRVTSWTVTAAASRGTSRRVEQCRSCGNRLAWGAPWAAGTVLSAGFCSGGAPGSTGAPTALPTAGVALAHNNLNRHYDALIFKVVNSKIVCYSSKSPLRYTS